MTPPAMVSLAVLVVAFVGAWVRLPGLPGCWFLEATGLPCPGCGLTRGFFAITRGDFAEAWLLNPFALPVFGLVLLTAVDPLLPWRKWVKPAWRGRVAAGFAVAWIGWGVWRMGGVLLGW